MNILEYSKSNVLSTPYRYVESEDLVICDSSEFRSANIGLLYSTVNGLSPLNKSVVGHGPYDEMLNHFLRSSDSYSKCSMSLRIIKVPRELCNLVNLAIDRQSTVDILTPTEELCKRLVRED